MTAGTPDFARVIAAMRAKGDDFLARICHHAQGVAGHYAEEINRSTGQQQGASDLTWNYAAFLSAFQARG